MDPKYVIAAGSLESADGLARTLAEVASDGAVAGGSDSASGSAVGTYRYRGIVVAVKRLTAVADAERVGAYLSGARPGRCAMPSQTCIVSWNVHQLHDRGAREALIALCVLTRKRRMSWQS